MTENKKTCEYWAGEYKLIDACGLGEVAYPAHCTLGKTNCYDGKVECDYYKKSVFKNGDEDEDLFTV